MESKTRLMTEEASARSNGRECRGQQLAQCEVSLFSSAVKDWRAPQSSQAGDMGGGGGREGEGWCTSPGPGTLQGTKAAAA